MRKLIKKLLPKRETVEKQAGVSWLGDYLNKRNIWKVDRKTISGGVALGLFVNFLPIPFQMLWAALLAIVIRVNLPVASLMAWINNPLTTIPINFGIYKIGTYFVNPNGYVLTFAEFGQHLKNVHHFWHEFYVLIKLMWAPYLVGLAIVCFGSALIGYVLVRLLWKISDLFRKKESGNH